MVIEQPDIKGPLTLVAGKKRRLTFIECANDLNSMCDLAKTADLVLLLVDAAFGFEMETFEFLNIAQTHGFPKVNVDLHCYSILQIYPVSTVKLLLAHSGDGYFNTFG